MASSCPCPDSTTAPGAPTSVRPESATIGDYARRHLWSLVLAGAGFAAVFGKTFWELAEYWGEEPDFSHGFLIPVISGAILWSRRQAIAATPCRTGWWGAAVLVLALVLFLAGHVTHTNIVQRGALWAALVGMVWFAFGGELLRRQPFPFFFLLFMIPPHFQLLTEIRFILKGLATRVAADLLPLVGVSTSPQGNLLIADGHPLEVADACSGIRSLMAIVATAALFGFLFRTGVWKGTLLIATAVPVTIAINVLRIIVVAVALVRFDVDLATGAAHDALGFVVFGLSLVLLFASAKFYDWLFRWGPKEVAR